MSTSQDYARRQYLEQNPALLPEVERAIPTAAALGFDAGKGNAETPSTPVAQPDNWPEPEPLGGELPPVQAFDSALLPDALRPLVVDTADRMQVPLDYPAVVAVLSLAGATNRRALIQPKAADTSFTVVPNLWGGIVAPPGLMKSPVISVVTRPLTRIEALWHSEYESAVSDYNQAKELAELRQAAWREQFKAAQKSGHTAPARPDESIGEPICRRLITQDATAEKLHEILRDNPSGVLVIRDELSGWLATLDKQGREGEREFFLSAWNGDTPYTMDRIGRGSVYAEACCVSILGGIQPARLRSYLTDTLQDGPRNDGLFQRFQVLVYPDIPRHWDYVDRAPSAAAITQAEQLFSRLAHVDEAAPRRFRFDSEAQQLFIAWLTDLEGKLRGDALHPALVAHLAKYRKLMPALALLFESADGGTETVSLKHAQQAAAWCDYLESHARRVYSMMVSPERQAAAELGRHLKAGWKRTEGLFTTRDVYRNNWTGLNEPGRVRAALDILSDAGWIRPVDIAQPIGRPTERYAISPKLAGGAK
jgi:putative DNA primase/helicase